MSDLTRFRDHCAAMAAAEHKPTCPWTHPEKCKPTPRWGWVYGDDGSATGFGWLGMSEPPPPCDGCNPDADRALFARLAAEVDDYLEPHPTLWGDDASPEPATGARSAEPGSVGVPGPSEDGEGL